MVVSTEHPDPSTIKGLTSVAHFFPEFLSIRVELALFPRSRAAPTLTDVYRHVAVARRRRWGTWVKSGHSILLVHNSHVTSGKYAL